MLIDYLEEAARFADEQSRDGKLVTLHVRPEGIKVHVQREVWNARDLREVSQIESYTAILACQINPLIEITKRLILQIENKRRATSAR